MRSFTFLLTASVANAAILLPSHIASSMVWPANKSFAVWGLDAPGATVTLTFAGLAPLTSPPADATGRFSIAAPPMPTSAVPTTATFTSTSGAPAVVLADLVVGDIFFCSGQCVSGPPARRSPLALASAPTSPPFPTRRSNMELSVQNTAEYAAVVAASSANGPLLRLFQVAMLDSYVSAVVPASNLTASIPWSRASPSSAPAFSALCYNFGVLAATARGTPIGMIDSSWGGVAIQVWMSPAALQKCGAAAAPPPSLAERLAAGRAPGASPGERGWAAFAAAHGDVGASPVNNSCLYNSMLHPLLTLPVTGLLWVRGARWARLFFCACTPTFCTHPPPTHPAVPRGVQCR